ncbi:cingulin-like [Haliotis rubra]|uniref:cingulin-like n=1 Tax=Haliotis rubra TaxID=36100 RepID=UPI001EE61745|nr:cingulin-like [Haliotis rubra]
MNWESKFSSIVQETEANLAKVKQKLRSKANLSADTVSLDYSASPLLSTSLGHYPAASTPKTRLMDRYGHKIINSNIRHELTGMPQSSVLQLQEQIEDQNATISRLNKTVQCLEKERGEYQTQIQMLRSEVSELSSHVLERGGRNPHLEWQMDQIKRDLEREVKDVRDQLQLFRTRIDSHSTSDQSSISASRNIDEVRQDIHDELRYIRKDVDALRRRVGSVEMDVMGSHYDRRDLERSQERMNKSLHEISNGRTRNLAEILKTCPDADRTLGHTQLEHLRSTRWDTERQTKYCGCPSQGNDNISTQQQH